MTTSSMGITSAAYQRYADYVEHIKRCCRTPGVRAALRSGLRRTPEQASRMHAVVTRWLPQEPSAAQERAYYTVAALIASQSRTGRDDERDTPPTGDTEAPAGTKTPAEQQHVDTRAPARRRSLGRSLADLETRSNTGKSTDVLRDNQTSSLAGQQPGGPLTPVERRLHLLSRQSLDGLHRQLPAVVLRLRDERIEVDWVQLLADLIRWPRQKDRISKRWMQDYYRATSPPAADTPVSDPTSSLEGINE
jgi:CRISPR system Cascade subunit CasB